MPIIVRLFNLSVSGFVFLLFGAPMSWGADSDSVSLLTTEVEDGVYLYEVVLRRKDESWAAWELLLRDGATVSVVGGGKFSGTVDEAGGTLAAKGGAGLLVVRILDSTGGVLQHAHVSAIVRPLGKSIWNVALDKGFLVLSAIVGAALAFFGTWYWRSFDEKQSIIVFRRTLRNDMRRLLYIWEGSAEKRDGFQLSALVDIEKTTEAVSKLPLTDKDHVSLERLNDVYRLWKNGRGSQQHRESLVRLLEGADKG